jgi:hypothetical protein
MGRRTLLLISSVLLAAVGTAIVAVYVRQADDRATRDQATAAFVVAGRAIEEGTVLSAEDVTTRLMRVNDQLPTTATSLDEVVGKRVTSDVLPETTIDTRLLALAGAEVDDAAVRQGELGVNVLLQDPNRAVSLLGVGSWVRVFTLRDEGARPLVDEARVISIGASVESSTAEGPDGENSVGSSTVPAAVVGLSVPEEQAQAIMTAQMRGQPTYFAVIPSADVTAAG